MKMIKIDNRDYVLKFTSKVVSELNANGISFNTLLEDMQAMKVDNLYKTFYYGISSMNKVSYDEALELIDKYYENEDNTMEVFFMLVIEEYSKALGLGKFFKEMMREQRKQQKHQKKQRV